MLLNKDLIAVNQDPLGAGGNRISMSKCNDGTCQIWAKKLKMGGEVAVALYNSVTLEGLASKDSSDIVAHRAVRQARLSFS